MSNHNDIQVSIITVVFNGAKTIEQTINSVLNQSYTNIEYIIIDGGSTDGTLDIIKKFEKNISFWVSEPDRGLYDAMNKGISKASGDIIGMINSDDWYELNAVDLIVEAYKINPEKRIIHGDRYDIRENGTKQIRKFNFNRLKFIYYGMTYNHPSMFVHKEIYKKSKYDTSLKSLSDYEFVLTQYLLCKEVFYYLPIPYVNYRLDGISAQIKFWESLKEGYLARRKAKLPIIMNLFSFIIRFSLKIFLKHEFPT